jgi:protein-tyrosine kinase
MERIKQALERARAERQQPSSDAGTLAPSAQTERAQPQDANTRETAPIAYTQTQTLSLPERKLKQARLVAALDDSPQAAGYKVLRTQVLHRLRLNGWNSLAVTSPSRGDGKTLTAVNLAVALAREVNQTVLLVDMDLRAPSVHKHFDHHPKAGLSDYILNDVALPDMLFNPGIDGLVVLPGRESIAMSSEAISSPKVVRLIDELKSRYPSRIVVFDLPPLLVGDDVIAFAPCVDSVLMVAREGHTRRSDLERVVEVLGKTPIIGTVLNDSVDQLQAYY